MSHTPSATFSDIDDDALIHIFSFMSISDILRMRQVSKRTDAVSKMRIIWQRALYTHVLDRGIPFPNVDVDTIDCSELEVRTRRAFKLGQFWLNRTTDPRLVLSFAAASSATGISAVRFLPAHPDWLITLTKGIWSLITCWDIGTTYGPRRKIAEWSPRQTLITDIAVNSDPHSEAHLAVSLLYSGSGQDHMQTIQILQIRDEEIVALRTIPCAFRVMSLQGNTLAAGDDVNEAHVIDWTTGDYAVMWGSEDASEYDFQHNRCLQVLFAPKSVFVARARSLEVFLGPKLLQREDVTPAVYNRPTALHRYGWIDGVSMSLQGHSVRSTLPPPLSIVLRAESDDPWYSDVHTLNLYTVQPNPAFAHDQPLSWTLSDEARASGSGRGVSGEFLPAQVSPYLLPPVHQTSWISSRGHLRCKDILVGSHGTAVWIQPRPARNLDLTAYDVHSSDTQRPGQHSPGALRPTKEMLVAALLPSRLRDCQNSVDNIEDVRILWTFEGANGTWTTVDYDEARGLVALGDSQGNVEILEL